MTHLNGPPASHGDQRFLRVSQRDGDRETMPKRAFGALCVGTNKQVCSMTRQPARSRRRFLLASRARYAGDGCERETRYRRVGDGTDPARAQLVETGIVLPEEGHTSHIITPARDIHRVENPTAQPSLSLHVYGADIGVQRRRNTIWRPAPSRYVTPHDSVERDAQAQEGDRKFAMTNVSP